MKNVRVLALLTAVVFLFIRCTPDQDYISNTKEIISQGKWSVDYYFSGQNKTAQYTNFQFTFSLNGTVSCTDGTQSFNGSWAMTRDVNRNDVLLINMSNQQPNITQLNAQWNVTNQSTSLVDMTSGGSAEIRFKKL